MESKQALAFLRADEIDYILANPGLGVPHMYQHPGSREAWADAEQVRAWRESRGESPLVQRVMEKFTEALNARCNDSEGLS